MDNVLLNDILRAADKHPNSKVSKLIRTVEEEPFQKNIVLLLIELSDHAEFATDFNISLRYYLDLFERLGINRDLILNEAGLLLLNSSKIYSKRVDYVQSLVERQILTLSNADQEIQQEKEQKEKEAEEKASASAAKPKRGRKRALDAPTDPYEVQLEPKKIKKMTQEKRFSLPKTPTKIKSLPRNVEVEQQLHPASWLHATIYDLENDEEVDTKRNYKLFTYHVEHRYNTLVPDINFRLHYKVKDYIDAQEEAEEGTIDGFYHRNQEWPASSEEYVQKYIDLENHVLQLEIDPTKQWEPPKKLKNVPLDIIRNQELGILNTTIANDTSSINDSGMGTSFLESSFNTSRNESNCQETALKNNASLVETAPRDNLQNSTQNQSNDSALGESLLDQTNLSNESNTEQQLSISDQINVSNGTSAEINVTDKSLLTSEADKEAVLREGNENGVTNSDIKAQAEATEKNSTLANFDTVATSPENIEGTSDSGTINANENKAANENIMEIVGDNGVIENATGLKEANVVEVASHADAEKSTILNEKEKTTATKTNTSSLVDGTVEEFALQHVNGDKGVAECLVGDKVPETTILPNQSSTDVVSIEKDGGFIELEIHVMEENENEPSERLQLQISATDDEGVHLSDVFEGDLQMLSPAVSGVSNNKDMIIYMDDDMRKALASKDGVMEEFSQETYKVPVIQQPREHPIVLNIFHLPPKLLRRKILFKLGPEMDLYLKARCLKPTRIKPPAREYRMGKKMLLYALNNTDMSGIMDTPPNSPGHQSDFCGFTDDEVMHDEDTICSEFLGFNEDEPNKVTISPHRLSRDSGVGVEGALLTPEKEALEIIFEENLTDVNKCKLNLNAELTNVENAEKQTTEDILNDLPDSIRSALEAEIQGGLKESITDGLTETETTISVKVIDSNTIEKTTEQNSKLEELNHETVANDASADGVSEVTTLEKNSAVSNEETLNKPSEENSLEKATNLSGEDNIVNESLVQDHTLEKGPQIESLFVKEITLDNQIPADNNASNHTLNQESISDSLAIKGQNSGVVDANCQQDNDLIDLNLHGTKTKIQQWHEHLRPILAKSRERHHFDVFNLGTEIIETIQTNDTADNLATFGDIMDEKDKSYVSRYFLSTLLLANQGNVNISVKNQSSESPSSWSDIGLKLLSTKRHTVAIEDNIGMISDKKRKQNATNEELVTKPKNAKKKKKQMVHEDVDDDEDDDEPLVKLQTKSKDATPSKRPSSCSAPSHLREKKFKEVTASTPTNHNTKECLIFSQENLPPLTDVPTTSRQAQQQAALNPEVNLNNMRIMLQPIEKMPRQGDDHDSGIFSLDEVSSP
uniref:Condensin-2 complex subunit H2 C-terminal domain-containing protein n=1 Tax=Stomoxys calcitrans TaxID=35570 RepID=A0A1I8NW13_STOCA